MSPPFLSRWPSDISLHISLSQRFLPFLKCSSFAVQHLKKQIGPCGKLCETQDRQFSVKNLGSIVDAFSRELLLDEALEAPRGHRITTEEGRMALLEEIMNGCREEGTYTPTTEVVAYKI